MAIDKMNRASLSLTYNDKDISEALAAHTVSFSYTDHDHGKADDLRITLEDRKGLWKNTWFPSKGAILTARISSRFMGEIGELFCGTFAIDEISVQGPPDTAELKAVSSFTEKPLKLEEKSRSWEDRSLEAVVTAIASEHGLTAFYDGPEITYDRIDQRQESDLTLIKRLCEGHDLCVKVTNSKLVVFESRRREEVDPAFTITRGISVLSRYAFATKTHDIYRACEVLYWDSNQKTERVHRFDAPEAPASGQVLRINKRMENRPAAIRCAKAMLREKNKDEITTDLDLMGNPRALAGMTFKILGFGVFDGKYLITESVHSQDRSQGYRTSVKARKVLGW